MGNARPTGGRRKAALRYEPPVPPRSPKKPEPPFATTEEIVAITHVERQTLRQWVRRGLLPPAKIVSDGNGVKSRWPRVALEQAASSRRCGRRCTRSTRSCARALGD